MIVNYADEYVEAIVSKWQKMLPRSDSYEYKSNVALALENQYVYHKKVAIDEDINRHLVLMSYKILPLFFTFCESLAHVINFNTFIGEQEILRTKNNNYELTTFESTIAEADLTDTSNQNCSEIAYHMYQNVQSYIFNCILTKNSRKYVRNNLKLDRNLQFVYSQMKSEGCSPTFLINHVMGRKTLRTNSHINSWKFQQYQTANDALKHKLILGNMDDIYYCMYVPIKYVGASNRKLSSKKVHIFTDRAFKMVDDNSVAVIEG